MPAMGWPDSRGPLDLRKRPGCSHPLTSILSYLFFPFVTHASFVFHPSFFFAQPPLQKQPHGIRLGCQIRDFRLYVPTVLGLQRWGAFASEASGLEGDNTTGGSSSSPHFERLTLSGTPCQDKDQGLGSFAIWHVKVRSGSSCPRLQYVLFSAWRQRISSIGAWWLLIDGICLKTRKSTFDAKSPSPSSVGSQFHSTSVYVCTGSHRPDRWWCAHHTVLIGTQSPGGMPLSRHAPRSKLAATPTRQPDGLDVHTGLHQLDRWPTVCCLGAWCMHASMQACKH
jgi:hypothetical protein